MKKVAAAIIAIFLLALTASADNVTNVSGTLRVRQNSIVSEPVTATTEDITLYVRTTGADTNDGLTVGTALLTPQEAIGRLPKVINHYSLVDIGEGTFDGFDVADFDVNIQNGLIVQGQLRNPTLTTGAVSGTSTGGSTSQLIDAGQNWTANELRGMFLLVEGEYRLIRNNDDTTINMASVFAATCSGKVYEIQEPSTVINTESYFGKGRISIRNIRTNLTAANPAFTSCWYLQNLRVEGGSFAAVLVESSSGGTLSRIQAIGPATMGILIETCTGTAHFYETYSTATTFGYYFGMSYGIGNLRAYAYDTVSDGFRSYNTAAFENINATAESCGADGFDLYSSSFGVEIDWLRSIDNTLHGLKLASVAWTELKNGLISGNGNNGIYIDERLSSHAYAGGTLTLVGANVIENNTLSGIIAKNHSYITLGACTGTNAGAYGLELQDGSKATITSATAITGATGDATINGGTTDLTWATDFAADGDMVINLDNACRIERKDP